jgi:integrase
MLRVQEEAHVMGRKHYTDPAVLKTSAKRPKYYIRPSVPVLKGPGTIEYEQVPVYLGWVDEVGGKRAAERLKQEYLRTINRTPEMIQSQVQFSNLVDAYRESFLRAKKPGTRRGYESKITRYILPTFGAAKLCEVTSLEVQAWCNNLPLSRASKRNTLAVLASIMEWAAFHGYTQQRNPAKGVDLGPSEPSKYNLRALEPSDVMRLFAAAGDDLRVMIEVAFYCGLRIGEIRGLSRAAIEPPEIRVFQQLDQATGNTIPPKNGKERRVVAPGFLVEKLSRRPADERGLIIPAWSYDKHHGDLKALMRGLGLWRPGCSWHALRRTYTTLRDELGHGGIQQSLGHSKASTTRGYIRPTVRRQVEEVEAMAELMIGNEKGSVQ